MDENKYGHWNVSIVGEFEPSEWFGFIYCIVNIQNSRKYIGKKQLIFTLRKKIKNRTNRKKTVKESDWKIYTGSSEELNSDISLYGIENFTFSIIKLCKTKRDLGYYEVEEQFQRKVLTSLLESGIREYYNKSIMNRWFCYKDEVTEETAIKMSRRRLEFWSTKRSIKTKKKLIERNKSPENIAKQKITMKKNGHQKLERNSQYNTIWITNLYVNRKINKDDPIPEGFKRGITKFYKLN